MKLPPFVWVVCAALASCGGGGPTASSSCTPGATATCPCANGTTGAQVCNRAGTFDACRCASVDGGVDASPPPADAPADAPAPDGGLDAVTPPDVSPADATTPDATADVAPVDAASDRPSDVGDAAGPACTGISLAADGVLDLDVRAVRVRGAVTFNGAAAPAASSRGSLTFARREGGAATVSLAGSGPATYDLLLALGTYDVRYIPPLAACATLPAPLPCTEALVREGVALGADGVLDLDVQSVLVRGGVTLNGAAFPNAAVDRGGLTLSRDGGGSVTLPLGATGAATWSARVARGTYAVGWSPSMAACAAEVGTPCGGGTIRAGVALTADGVLDIDVPTVRVSGALTVGGVAPAGAVGSTNYLYFTPEGSGPVLVALGTGGTYRSILLPGTYGIQAYGGGLCTADSPLPCGFSQLRSGFPLRTSGVLDFDVRGVRIRGSITVNGAPPDALGAGRLLIFSTAAGGSAPLFLSGSVRSYSAFLSPGTYDVSLGASSGACSAPTAASLPCNGATVRANVPLTADGVLDLDFRTVRVRGASTLNGASRADWNGSLVFAAATGGDAAARLGADGRYDVVLAAGTYGVAWAGLASCPGASPFPCNRGALRAGVALTADGVLDLDLRAARVRGAVTLNGAPMPMSARGGVEFTGVAGGSATAAIGATGASTYDVAVLPGAYVVSHQGPNTGCAAVPCMAQRLRGCP